MRSESLTEFDSEIFQALVKKITVYGRENFEFELTNGQVAKVKTYYYHNKEDEIDEVVYEKVWANNKPKPTHKTPTVRSRLFFWRFRRLL